MYRKNCQNCSESSFSSSQFGKWFCPVCGNDLTNAPFYDSITFEQLIVTPYYFEKHKLNYKSK